MKPNWPKHNYSVKGVKSFRGMEGYGFNATLYRDNKKIAFVIDKGCGGCLLFQEINDDEEKKLIDFCKTIPSQTLEGMELQPDMDWFVTELVQDYEHRKLCKGKTLFRLKGDKNSQFRVLKIPYGDSRVKKHLETSFSNKLEQILNEECQQFI